MNDIEIQQLEELGGIGTGDIEDPSERSSEICLESLSAKSDELDKWHILMVELAYVLNASFRDVHYWEGVKSKKNTFLQFVKTLHELDRMQKHDKTVRINYRGSRLTNLPAKLDYIIQFGELVVDYTVVSDIIKRQGLRFKHLEGRIKKAFEAFAEQAISSVTLTIPGRYKRSLELMQISLRIFSCYNQAVETQSPISYERKGIQHSLMPVVDEYDQPDPNLTILAALNDLNETTMQGLVHKVALMDDRNDGNYSEERLSSVYQTLFKIKNLQEKLIKPPLEVNTNNSIAMFMSQGETVPDEVVIAEFDTRSVSHLSADIDTTILKNAVAQFAKATFKGSVQHAKLAMKSVFAQDYHQVNLKTLGQRFKLLSHLLKAMEKNPRGQKIIDGALRMLQTSIDKVPGELLDNLVVHDNVVKFWSGENEIIVGEIDGNLQDVIDVSKGRSYDQKKSRPVISPYEDLQYEDYQALADRFDITVIDAEQLVSVFKNCFDTHHNFQRTLFTKNMPDFMRFGKNTFEILWGFLKETPERKDRLPLLNSLQLLVKETKEPIAAVKILLSDFIMNSNLVSFPDRNAIMLVNQFLRTYNKEINMDIEITPEEVLLVKVGLNQKSANYAAWRVDGERNKFLEKIVLIRKRLVEALEAFEANENQLPIRFLLALEREVHILLALAGGETAGMVLRSALKVYGNPESQVYRMKESSKNMTQLIQHLAALIRGFGRVGNMQDLELLDEIKVREAEFIDLKAKDQRHEALIKRTMGWIDMAKNEIGSRPAQAATISKKPISGQQPANNAVPQSPVPGATAQAG